MRGCLLFLIVFLLLGSDGVKGQIFFGEEQVIKEHGSIPYSVFSADLDGDGDLDLIVTSLGQTQVKWYENDGNGNFESRETLFHRQGGDVAIALADTNNDEDIDIIVAHSQLEIIFIYENDGNGNFSLKQFKPDIPEPPVSIYAADMDGDEDNDLIVAFNIDGTASWFKNTGGGKGDFDDKKHGISHNATNVLSIYSEDLDADGDMDILASCDAYNEVVWHKNNGLGNFSNRIVLSSGDNSDRSKYVADLDGDGFKDILIISSTLGNISWCKNDGNEYFNNKTLLLSDAIGITYISTIDVDKDGDVDIVGALYDSHEVNCYLNDGKANFSPPIPLPLNKIYPTCAHMADLDGDADFDLISVTRGGAKVAWSENLSPNMKIIGFAFHDSNENGMYEDNEKPLSNQQIILQPSADVTFSNIEGYNYFFVSNGEYQLSAESSTLWEHITSETYSINVTNDSELSTYYFGFKPTRILPRVEPHLSNSPTRCSTVANYWLNYSNTGTTTANGTITLEVDELMGFISANPEPDLIEGQTLIWSITDLSPSFENKIRLQFQTPDFNSIGEILETQTSLQLVNENNELVYTKSTEYNSEVLCSYDPNDKLTRSNLLGQSEFAYIEDTIYYTIRFQNTGNDVAFDIRVEDVLDKKLDWTTFHPITASHDFRTELNRETGLATFFFDDIMLPDSTTNEVESHGFVTFGIASLAGIGDKTEVENTANIFFDFNPPIVTNTVVNTLIEEVETDIHTLVANEHEHKIRVFPNPFSDFTTIEVEGLSKGNYQLELMDILGRKVRELKSGNNGQFRIERGELESGVYLVRVLEDEGKVILGSGKIIVN